MKRATPKADGMGGMRGGRGGRGGRGRGRGGECNCYLVKVCSLDVCSEAF